MSGGGGSTTTSNSSPPPQFLNAYTNLINAATQQAQQPLEQYTGSMIQGFTPDQLQAMTTVENSQGMAQPYINSAAQYAAAGASPVTGQEPWMQGAANWGNAAGQVGNVTNGYALNAGSYANSGAQTLGVAQPYMSAAGQYGAVNGQQAQNYAAAANQGGLASAGSAMGQAGGLAQGAVNAAGTNVYGSLPQFSQQSVQQYMSPYTQDVVNATQAEFNNQNQQQSQQLTGNAISAGAYGGDRESVAQAELANQQQLAQAPTIAGLENSGYQTAASQFQTEQQLQAQTESQQASLEASTGLGAANTALQGGQLGLSAALGGGQLGESAALGAGQLGANTQLSEAGLAGQDWLGGASLGASTSSNLANILGGQYLQGTGQGLQASESNAQLAGNLGISQDYLNANAGYEMASLGNEAQNSALTGASAELGTGAQQQQLGQEQLNIPYEEFEQQQAYPYQQLNWLGGLTEGAGSLAGGTSSTTQNSGNSTSSDIGMGLAAAALLLKTGGRVANEHERDAPVSSDAHNRVSSDISDLRSGKTDAVFVDEKHKGAIPRNLPPSIYMKHARGGILMTTNFGKLSQFHDAGDHETIKRLTGRQAYYHRDAGGMIPDPSQPFIPNPAAGAHGAGPPRPVNAPQQQSSMQGLASGLNMGSQLGKLGGLGGGGSSQSQRMNGGAGIGQQIGSFLGTNGSGIGPVNQAMGTGEYSTIPDSITGIGDDAVSTIPASGDLAGLSGMGDMAGLGDIGDLAELALIKTGGRVRAFAGGAMLPIAQGGPDQGLSATNTAPNAPTAQAPVYRPNNGTTMLPIAYNGTPSQQVPVTGMRPMNGGTATTGSGSPPPLSSANQYMMNMLGGMGATPQAMPTAQPAQQRTSIAPQNSSPSQQVPLTQQMQPMSGGLTSAPMSAPQPAQQQAPQIQWHAPNTPVFDPTNYANSLNGNGSQNSTAVQGVSQINQPMSATPYQRPQFNMGQISQLMQAYPGLFGGNGFQGLGAFGGQGVGAFSRGGYVHRASGGGLSIGATPQQQGSSPAQAAMMQQYQSMSLQQLQQASAMSSPGSPQAQAIQYALASKLSRPATQITVNSPQGQAGGQGQQSGGQQSMAAGGSAPGSGGAAQGAKHLSGPTGIATPQVSSSMFTGINPALSGGSTGMGSTFNPLPQYQPPGTTVSSTGGIQFPHSTTMLNPYVLQNLRGTGQPLSATGTFGGINNQTQMLGEELKSGGRARRADGGGGLDDIDPPDDTPAPPTDMEVSPTAGPVPASDTESMTGKRGGGMEGLSTPSLFGAPPQLSNTEAADAGKGLAAATQTATPSGGGLASTPSPQAPNSQINAGGLASGPSTQPQKQGAHWLEDWSPPAQDHSGALQNALFMAGAAMMAGRSGRATQNIGTGMMAGMQEYQKQLGADDKPIVDHSGDTIRIYYPSEKKWFDTGMPTESSLNRQQSSSQFGQTLDLKNKELAQSGAESAAKLAQTQKAEEDRLALERAQLGNTQSYQQSELALRREQMEQGKYGQMTPGTGKDAEGNDTQGVYVLNQKTGKPEFTPGAVLTPKNGQQSGPSLDADTIDALAARANLGDHTAQSGLGFGSVGAANRAAVANRMTALQKQQGLTPNAIAENQMVGAKTASDFATGKSGQTLQAADTYVGHAEVLKDYARAMDNGDVNLINAAKNRFMMAFGSAPPNTYQALAPIVADEGAKAVLGSAGALADREAFVAPITSAKSFGQIADALDGTQALAAGRVSVMKNRYEQLTRQNDFNDRFLTPESREVYGRFRPELGNSSAAPAKQSGSQPNQQQAAMPPLDQRVAGKTTIQTPKGQAVWQADGWHLQGAP